jgi:hypothetical protein
METELKHAEPYCVDGRWGEKRDMTITETDMAPTIIPAESAADLQEYRKIVASVAGAADGRVIVNRSGSHASVVIEHIIRAATSSLDMLTGHLHEPIYGAAEIMIAMREFLDRPAARLRVLSEQRIADSHPIRALIACARAEVDLRVMPDPLAAITDFHFILADGRSFRFEGDKHTFEAHAQFGEQKLGERLKAVFERLFAQAPKGDRT